jgi:hypothetical protein
MNRRFILLLACSLLLGACAPATSLPAPTATGTSAEQPSPTPIPATATPIPSPTATATPVSNRTATFADILNAVDARTSQNVDFAPANLGQILKSGGEARTGEDGKARLDLAPDGTIIRVAPNSTFTVLQLYGDETSPYTKLELFIGKVWILLKGGSLDVETPSGVASVLGSLLGVSYDPETNSVTATCLEGHCRLANGDKVIELTEGQAADILNGVLADTPRYMTIEEVSEWLSEAPELRDFLDKLPDIPGIPGDLFDRLGDRINIPGGLPGRGWPPRR